MTVALLLLALVFGAGDQYLGSLSAHPWGADVSGLSAPWLLLPFAVGAVQSSPRRAAVTGFGCTFAALCGYLLMTLSPLENAHYSVDGVVAFVRSGNYRWFAAGAVTGPGFALLGHQWRGRRALWGALVVAALICLEAPARALHGNAIRSSVVAGAEVAVGLVLAGAVVVRHRSGAPTPSSPDGDPL